MVACEAGIILFSFTALSRVASIFLSSVFSNALVIPSAALCSTASSAYNGRLRGQLGCEYLLQILGISLHLF